MDQGVGLRRVGRLERRGVPFELLAHAKGDRRKMIRLGQRPGVFERRTGGRAAFGRLTHAVQDFYSHSNYVDLWLGANGGLANSRPEDINGLDPALLNHPALTSGYFYLWRDIIYYLPVIDRFAKKHLVFPGSHEAMNLDEPDTGPKFPYSLVAAKQRTLAEYQRAVQALSPEQAARFYGALVAAHNI